MADMQASMRLTLEDLASPRLSAFIDRLRAIDPIVAGVSDRLSAFEAAAAKVGVTLNSAFASSGALDGLKAISSALSSMSRRLGNLDERLTAVQTSISGLGESATTATAGIESAGNAISGMAAKSRAAQEEVATLGSGLRDLAKLWAAVKIEQGIKASASSAVQYQNTQTRLANLNIGAAGTSALTAAANRTAGALPQMSRQQTLSMGIDLVNATGSVADAVRMMQPFAQAIYNMQRANPSGHMSEQSMLLVAKALEQRGVTMNPAAMQRELDVFSQIMAATQGRVGPRQLLGNINYAKGGLGLTLSDQFMPIFASLIERTMGGGGNAGQVGTALTSLQQAIVGGVIKQSALPEWGKMGLLDPSKMVWNKVGTLKGVQAGGIAGADMFMRNPYEWVQTYLVPALKRSGVDTTNAEQVDQALAHLFGNRNAANIAATMATQQGLLEKDAGVINQTRTNAGQYQNNANSTQGKLDQFHAALDNLKIAIGQSILPALTRFVEIINSAITGVSGLARAFPHITAAVTLFGAAISAFLALSVFVKLGSAIGGLLSIFRGAGAALAGVVTAIFGVATRITTAGAELVAAFQPWIPMIGEALLGLLKSVFMRVFAGLGMLLYSKDASANEDQQMAAMRQRYVATHPMAGVSNNFGVSAAGGWGSPPVAHGSSQSGASSQVLFPTLPASSPVTHARRRHASIDPLSLFVDEAQRAHGQAGKELAPMIEADKKAADALKAIADKIAAASAKNGNPAQAIRDKYAGYAQQLRASGNPHYAALANQADALGNRLGLESELAQAKKVLADLQTALREKEKVTAAQVQAGQLTKIQGTDQTIAQQRNAAPGLMNAAQHVRDLEQALGQTTGAIDATIASFQALGQTITQFQGDVQNTIQGGFQKMFSNIMRGNESWRLMGAQLNNALLAGMNSAISQTMAQALSQSLGASLSGITGVVGSAAQGTGTFLGSLLGGNASGAFSQAASGIGSMFGNLSTAMQYGTNVGSAQTAMLAAQDAGMASASSGAASGGFMSLIGSLLSSFAVGADNIPNDMVANIHKGEMIIPAAGAEAIRSGKFAAQGHTVNMNIHAMDSQSVMGAMVGIKRELASMLGATNANLNLGGSL